MAQGLGGYHSPNITVDSHNLFEEVPSLGVAADIVMALTMDDNNPIPNFRMGRPAGSCVTHNLAGWRGKQWTQRTMQPVSASCESTAQMGAAYVFKFQIYKERGDGANATERNAKWCCLTATQGPEVPWNIPDAWLHTMNKYNSTVEYTRF